MAHHSKTRRQRDIINTTYSKPSLENLLATSLVRLPDPIYPGTKTRQDVLDSGDRRYWKPDENTQPPHTNRPGSSRVVAAPLLFTPSNQTFEPKPQRRSTSKIKKPGSKSQSITATTFANAPHVAICVRRKIRREVIHALKLNKRGVGKHHKKHRNFWSNVSC